MKRSLLASFIMLSCLGFSLSAQIVRVPADSSTIQSAINGASDGGTVLVAEGTYIENINFKGKAITVASHLLMDGDTSHISKTVIDGSQPQHSDTSSVVLMISGENTSSVLCGFTLMGGKGTKFKVENYNHFSGGGILILNSGGTIRNNIITENHFHQITEDRYRGGCGIAALLSPGDTLIIQDNLISNNSYIGEYSPGAGGGLFLNGGNILVERNVIKNNRLQAETNDVWGGGLAYHALVPSGFIPQVIIRNNHISGNRVYSKLSNQTLDDPKSFGGGVFINGQTSEDLDIQFYNNVITNNYSGGTGGGIILMKIGGGQTAPGIVTVPFCNNTIYNNEAKLEGNGIFLRFQSRALLLNNIIWSEKSVENSEIYILPDEGNSLEASYNDIYGGWEGPGNIDADPLFEPGTFELSEESPCIGTGADSINVGENWYYAAPSDFYGDHRPNPIDTLVDIGAIESAYKRIFVAGISLEQDTLNLDLTHNTSHTLSATIDPVNANLKSVTWTTEDSNIATVDQNGVVTAISVGSTEIYVKTSDGGYMDTCTVIVTQGTYVKENLAGKIRIYPNPSNKTITIAMDGSLKGVFEVRNLNGQLLHMQKIQSSSEQIDLSAFSRGIYFISIRSNESVITDKIIKL